MSKTNATKTQINWKEILERSEYQTGYNLYDLIPADLSNLQKIIEEDDIVIEAEIVDDNPFTDLKEKISSLSRIGGDLERKYKIKDAGYNSFIKNLVKTYNKIREEFFKKNNELPKEALTKINDKTLKDEEDVLTFATVAPRSKLGAIKKLSEALGFMIMPWEYHNKRSYEKESQDLKNSIKEFEKLEKFNMDLYVVSPINYWDIKAHISAKNPNKEMFYSSKIKDVVSAVEIQLPVLREFNGRITNLEERVDSLDKDMNKAYQAINKIQITLDKVVDDIARVWAEITEMKKDINEAKAAARDAQIAANEAESLARSAKATASRAMSMSMRAIDPLLIAVPKGANLKDDNVRAIVGPVWGPDFSWLVLAAENIEPKIGQRKLLKEFNPFAG